MTRSLAAAIGFTISTILAAHAAPEYVVVAYGDLDLSAAAGQSELKGFACTTPPPNCAARLCSPRTPSQPPGSTWCSIMRASAA